MLLTFWLQTSPFHSSSWKSHSIHYLCQAPCAVLAGRLYFEASMWHTKCHVAAEPCRNLFRVFKVWFFKSPKLYHLWIAQYTLLSPLPPQAGCKCSPRSVGKNQSNKKISSLHSCNYYSVVLILLMSPTHIWPAWGKKNRYTTSLLH